MQGVVILAEGVLVVMATYEYKHCGITKEVIQSITETLIPPKCAICNDDMTREYSPFGISFNASGFYKTDNR